MFEIVVSTLKQTLMITSFVMFMMVVIEYINVQTRNIFSDKIQKSPLMQIILAALLGISPGCLGAFTVVSLYTHRMMGLAGLVTVMIATSGDEAFVMFAMFPGKALLLNIILFVIAIAAGYIVHLFTRNNKTVDSHGYIVHEQENCRCFNRYSIIPQLRKISFERAVLLFSTALFLILISAGIIGPAGWDWKRITFLLAFMFLLFVFATIPDHFLKEHLYNHIMKKHLLRIFLWTWGVFIALYFIQSELEIGSLLQNNIYLVLFIAILIGIIPESGPHLLFVTLFSQNLIPFSILLASSIVQDGHGMIPLLAESRKDFIKVKLINVLIGLLVGLGLLLIGF